MLQRANKLKRTILRAVGDRYRKHHIPPLPLNIKETTELCNILKYKGYDNYDESFFMEQFKTRIVPGVDETTLLKADFLKDICFNNIKCNISKKEAIKILGTMQGGYNVTILTELLDCEKLAKYSVNQLKSPGCSLCMGNQARVEDNANVLSTSTRNFPNRLGKNSNVYLASAELSVITAIEGKIPDIDTYTNYMKLL